LLPPSNIVEYVKVKKNEDYIKAILDSLEELGIDISGIFIDKESLEYDDPKIGKLISIFFPDLENLDTFKEKGIFAFRSEYDFLEWDDPIIIERLKLLESLKKKRTDVFDKDYVSSYKYKENCLFMRQYLKVFERNFDKWVQNYDDLLEYADEFCFPDGPIDYFHPEYTHNLLDKATSDKEKEIIINMRLQYLNGIGFDTSSLDISTLYCDWYEREDLKDILPTKEYIEKISKLKQEKYDLFEYEAAKSCIINDFELVKDDSEIGTIIDGDGHSCAIYYRDGKIDTENFSNILCLNPYMSTYNLFDVAIDHEIRHAIETRMKWVDGKILLKTGCDLSLFDSELENGISKYTDTNERITQKLSIEAANDRWRRGLFIFSDKYAPKTKYTCSIYDLDLDNLDIIFEPFRKEIISSQISPSFTKIFETIPKRDLNRIDSLVTEHFPSATRKLKSIRRKLLKRKLEINQNKEYGNKISVKVKKKGTKNEKDYI